MDVRRHRGSGASKGPGRSVRENTVLSFQKAATSMCDFIEFDVHVTGDGEVRRLHGWVPRCVGRMQPELHACVLMAGQSGGLLRWGCWEYMQVGHADPQGQRHGRYRM